LPDPSSFRSRSMENRVPFLDDSSWTQLSLSHCLLCPPNGPFFPNLLLMTPICSATSCLVLQAIVDLTQNLHWSCWQLRPLLFLLDSFLFFITCPLFVPVAIEEELFSQRIKALFVIRFLLLARLFRLFFRLDPPLLRW